MSRYKKKKRGGLFGRPRPKKKAVTKSRLPQDDIVMSSSKEPKPGREKREEMRVVTGKRQKRNHGFKSSTVVMLFVAAAFLVLQTIIPAGVIQTVSNMVALIGTGSYPISISGTHHLGLTTTNQCYFDLSDTHISAYSNAGKQLFSHAHGFEKPILATSAGRVLLYNQGGTELYIFDLYGLKSTVSTKKNIICATISDSGNYAVATHSDKYATAVTVYNKRGKMIYEWYSAEDVVNNVVLSSNGKKIAVSTFSSNSGLFNAKVNILNYKSATPEYTKTYDKMLVLGLKNSNRSNLCVIKSNGVDHLRWSGKRIKEYNNDYTISQFRVNSSYNVSVFCRENDKTDNQIVLFSKSGKVKHTVKYKGIIKDIQVKGSSIYCINDSQVFVINFNGEKQHSASYGYGGLGLAVISTDSVAVASNDGIKKIKF